MSPTWGIILGPPGSFRVLEFVGTAGWVQRCSKHPRITALPRAQLAAQCAMPGFSGHSSAPGTSPGFTSLPAFGGPASLIQAHSG